MWNGVFGPARYEPLTKHVSHPWANSGRGHAPHMPDHIIIEMVDADFDPYLEDLISDVGDIAELGEGEFEFLVRMGWAEGDTPYHFFFWTDNPEPDPEEIKEEIVRYFRGA